MPYIHTIATVYARHTPCHVMLIRMGSQSWFLVGFWVLVDRVFQKYLYDSLLVRLSRQLICDGFIAVAAALVGPLAFLDRCACIVLF